MTKKVKLAFEQLEKELTVVDPNFLAFIMGGDGDCLADTLSYIYSGTTVNRDIYRNMLINAGVATAVYGATGYVEYMNITNTSGFIDVLNTGVDGFHVSGNLSSNPVFNNPQIQTMAKVNLGGLGPNGEPVSHAVIITGKDPDGWYTYKDVVNNVTGRIAPGSVQASITISCT